MHRLPWSGRATCVILFIGLIGCKERPGYVVNLSATPDAGAASGTTSDGSAGKDGSGARSDGGGNGDASAKLDTGGPCVKTGAPETCNGVDDDCDGVVDNVDPALLTTAEACGACGVVCPSPVNAVASCTNKVCVHACQTGYVDINKSDVDGCECHLTPGVAVDLTGTQPETECNDRDDDCDGLVDEGFDKKTDINNCGACNYHCNFPFTQNACENGACKMGVCLPGYIDRDKNPVNGCEYACAPTNGGVEICDGRDNDCNGLVDDGVTDPTPCKGLGVCAGTVPVCNGATGWTCPYPPSYETAEGMAKGCDGLDNDCDGSTDEAFGVGAACVVGVGGCQNSGTLVCNTAKTDVTCSVGPKLGGPEVCNGIDDDCDGKIDELEAGDRTTDDKLVFLAAPLNVTVFAFEASRYDSSATSAGADSSRRPCTVPGRQPWSNVIKEDAEKACRLVGAGWRLCTAAEWEAACRGKAGQVFPYGPTYDGATCNGADYELLMNGNPQPLASGVGAPLCLSTADPGGAAYQLNDMSGNVKEWVITGATNTDPTQQTYELRGGAYNTAGFNNGGVLEAPGLQCTSSTPAPAADVRLPSVGFRCCKTGAL